MKLYYVANSVFPSDRAHMTQIVAMCNAFAGLGHEVTLIVTDRKIYTTETPEVFFGAKLNFSVVRIYVPDIAGRSESISSILLPYLFHMQRMVYAYGVVRYVKKYPSACVYGRDEWVLWFISLFTKISLVWESHEARYSFVARRLLQKWCSLVVISEGIRDYYIRQGIDKEDIFVAHDAVDDRFFKPSVTQVVARETLGIRTSKPVVMYIGGLDAWKGVPILFDATREQDSFKVFVIGGRQKEIEAFQRIYPQIEFLGPRPYRELPALQQAADVLVIPNTATNKLSAEYTSPLKLFAYMSSKKVIVASRIPSITHVLNDTEAYFFTADDADDLQRVIKMAILHPEKAEEKAKRAYEKSLHYTWNKRAESILAFCIQYAQGHHSVGGAHLGNKTHTQIIVFILVGSWVAVFNYFSFYLNYTVIGFSYVYASVISFILTVCMSYFVQKNITFRNVGVQNKKTVRQIVLFYANALLGLFLNTCILFVGVDYLQLSPYVSQGISIIVLASYNFFIYRLILTE